MQNILKDYSIYKQVHCFAHLGLSLTKLNLTKLKPTQLHTFISVCVFLSYLRQCQKKKSLLLNNVLPHTTRADDLVILNIIPGIYPGQRRQWLDSIELHGLSRPISFWFLDKEFSLS